MLGHQGFAVGQIYFSFAVWFCCWLEKGYFCTLLPLIQTTLRGSRACMLKSMIWNSLRIPRGILAGSQEWSKRRLGGSGFDHSFKVYKVWWLRFQRGVRPSGVLSFPIAPNKLLSLPTQIPYQQYLAWFCCLFKIWLTAKMLTRGNSKLLKSALLACKHYSDCSKSIQ